MLFGPWLLLNPQYLILSFMLATVYFWTSRSHKTKFGIIYCTKFGITSNVNHTQIKQIINFEYNINFMAKFSSSTSILNLTSINAHVSTCSQQFST